MYILFVVDPDQEYIYFGVILIKNIYTLLMLIKNIYTLWNRKRSLRCKLLTEIRIPSARSLRCKILTEIIKLRCKLLINQYTLCKGVCKPV